MTTTPAQRFANIEISLIRQITALATPKSINLSIGEPNVEPDETLRELARRAATEGSWHYTANPGTTMLRERIVKSQSVDYDPRTEVCVTAGTQEGLYAVMQAFIGPGDEVLIPDPGFLAYGTIVQLAGGTARTYALSHENWRLNIDEVESQISDRTKAIIVNSPSNPTGGVENAATLDRLAKLADERDILLISDEVYREIHYTAESPGSVAGRGGNVVIANGMSKSHAMTGLRLGWLMARRDLMGTIIKSHQYIATCASSFSQKLAELILGESEWNRAWLQKVRDQFRSQRNLAVATIERDLGTPIRPPDGAFYLFVPVPSCQTVEFAKRLATEANVLTVPGVAFGAAGEGFLRLSFAASPGAIENGIRSLAEYLRQHKL